MPRTAPPCRSGNINLRVPPQQRDLIDQAARISLKTRTDFILEAATRAAEEALLDRQVFLLAPEAWETFQALLDRPPQENEGIRNLLARRPPWET